MTWLSKDAFWVNAYPFMYDERSFAVAAEQVPAILQLSGNQGGPVLDICCGPGRYAVPLAAAGLRVTGVDVAGSMLEKAGERAYLAQVELELIQDDMRYFQRENSFQTVVSLFTSFGYFETDADNQCVLDNAFASLRSGGACLIDVLGEEIWEKGYIGNRQLSRDDLHVEIQYTVADDRRSVLNCWQLSKQDEASHRYEFINQLYSVERLRAHFIAAGFTSIAVYGHWDGRPYDENAERLIMVGFK